MYMRVRKSTLNNSCFFIVILLIFLICYYSIKPSSKKENYTDDKEQIYKDEQLENWYKSMFGILPEGEINTCLEYLKDRKDIVLFDIGYNVGAFSDKLLQLRNDITIYGFEPIKPLIEWSEKNHKDDRKKLFGFGLGDKKTTEKLFIDNTSNLGWNTLIEKQSHSSQISKEIQLLKMDDLDLPKPDFIKIDVEGAEWMVLNGMRESIRKWNPKPIMIIEIGWGTNHPDREKEMVEFNYLFDNGYKKIILDEKGTADKLFIPI